MAGVGPITQCHGTGIGRYRKIAQRGGELRLGLAATPQRRGLLCRGFAQVPDCSGMFGGRIGVTAYGNGEVSAGNGPESGRDRAVRAARVCTDGNAGILAGHSIALRIDAGQRIESECDTAAVVGLGIVADGGADAVAARFCNRALTKCQVGCIDAIGGSFDLHINRMQLGPGDCIAAACGYGAVGNVNDLALQCCVTNRNLVVTACCRLPTNCHRTLMTRHCLEADGYRVARRCPSACPQSERVHLGGVGRGSQSNSIERGCTRIDAGRHRVQS